MARFVDPDGVTETAMRVASPGLDVFDGSGENSHAEGLCGVMLQEHRVCTHRL